MKRMNLKQIGYWTSVIVIGIFVGVSLQFVKAWTEPGTTPPGGNLGAPINTGAATQNKVGSLGTSGSFSAKGTVQGSVVKGTSKVCIGNDCRTLWSSLSCTSVSKSANVSFSSKGQKKTVTANCLSGYSVTGGSCSISEFASYAEYRKSYPAGSVGWTCEYQSNSTNNADYTIESRAVCCKL